MDFDMRNLIFGVDGGGTKSHLAIFTPDGAYVGAAATGALNYECMEGGYSEFEAVLPAFLLGALEKVGATVDDVGYAAFGLAGVDTPTQHARTSNLLRKIGFTRFTLCNDAFLGVPAGCPGGIGICAINGTGSTIAAIDNSGAAVQVSGVGEITGDLGGSSWYVMQAISAVYSELYKLGQPTLMRDMLFMLNCISRKEDYVEEFSRRIGERDLDIKAATCILFDAAETGDAVALDLLEQSAAHYAGSIAYLASQLDFPADRTTYVTLAGSVFTKQRVKILPQMIERRVRSALEGKLFEFLFLDAPPVAGAVLWAAQKAGHNIGMESIKEGLITAAL